jgi:L-threonylcarbamoyladenylate synthase
VRTRLTIDLQRPADAHLQHACSVLRSGGLIVYPTDTIYGIGADPGNESALRRVQQVKRRLDPKPLLLIASSLSDAGSIVRNFPPAAERLAKEFWPGPLTLVLPALPGVSQVLTQGTGTVGLRIPSSGFCLRLCALFGGPITSTSANISGEPTPATVGEMEIIFGDDIELYLDAGVLPSSPPSTLVDVSQSNVVLLREGAITRKRLNHIFPEMSGSQ